MNVSGLLTRWRQFGRRYFWPHLLLGMVAAPVSAACAKQRSRDPRASEGDRRNHNPSARVNFSLNWRLLETNRRPSFTIPSITGISTPFAPLFVISLSQWRRRRCRLRKKLCRFRLNIWRCSGYAQRAADAGQHAACGDYRIVMHPFFIFCLPRQRLDKPGGAGSAQGLNASAENNHGPSYFFDSAPRGV